MDLLLWQFWTYSFLGYLLEKIFAAVTRAENQGRKCFLLLPLCPVYGLGVLAVLALPPALTDSFWKLALWGGLAATAVEYAVHALYEWLLGVRFWDYSRTWGNLKGRVCVPFSLAWSVLLAVLLPWVHPPLRTLLHTVPPEVTRVMLVLFAADSVLSARYLYRTHDAVGISQVLFGGSL